MPSLYLFAADLVLLTHVLFVGFVVLGLVLIVLGGALGWGWVRYHRFRWLHLGAIGVVVLQAWLGVICPLTHLEMYLRERADAVRYSGSFIAHWLISSSISTPRNGSLCWCTLCSVCWSPALGSGCGPGVERTMEWGPPWPRWNGCSRKELISIQGCDTKPLLP